MQIIAITEEQKTKIINIEENHFSDVKSTDISPRKLTRTISAFANADGGEVYVGVEDSPRKWRGFHTIEDANGHIQIFDRLFPLGHGFSYSFLTCEKTIGFVLKIEVLKNNNIVLASDKKPYLRRSAQNLPQNEPTVLQRLKQNKGIVSFENELVNIEKDIVLDSEATQTFIKEVVPSTTPERWFKKQQLIITDRPTAASVILFCDEPQAILPKRSGLKLYRYQTKEDDGERAVLSFNPITIEGNAYNLIHEAVNKTVKIIEGIKIMTPSGLKSTRYPREALHEIVTNAVLHRDYSVPDDVHIRVFDNRVEIQSPGHLPAHITPENILEERFSRNGAIVRLINKFPNPPNKDVGEGLNTAFSAMRTVRLVDPIIEQRGMNVVVILKHESLGTPETLIMEYLSSHPSIANRQAREIANVGSENTMKQILRRMVKAKMLSVVKGRTVFETKYVKYVDVAMSETES